MKRPPHGGSCWLGLALFLAVSLSALAQRPVLRSLDLPRVVRNQTIEALVQDSTGMLWIGTAQGLLAYNGVDVPQLFTQAEGLAANAVTSLFVDRDGRLWIGHKSGAITVRERNRFRAFSPPEGLPAKPVTAFLQHPGTRELWFGTYGEGVYRWDGKRLHNLSIVVDTAASNAGSNAYANSDEADAAALLGEELPAGGVDEAVDTKGYLNIYCLATDRQGRVWAGTDNGISRFWGSKTGMESDSRSMRDGLPDNIVQDIVFGRDGTPWLALRDSGICRSTPDLKRYQVIPGWRYGPLRRMVAGSGDVLWVGTDRRGLVSYDVARRSYQVLSTAEGLAADRVTALTEDAQRTFWIGTNQGLTQLLGRRFAFLGRQEGLASDHVFSVLKDSRGQYWVGTDSGLTRISASADGRMQASTILRVNQVGKYAATVTSLTEDRSGRIWAGTYGGLFRIDGRSLASERHPKLGENTGVLSIAADAKGGLWLAVAGAGLVHLPQPNDFKASTRTWNSNQGLPSNYLYHIRLDARGDVWIATDGGGIARWDGRRFTAYGEAQGLASRTVYSIDLDQRGNLFALTADRGIFRLINGRFVPVPGGDASLAFDPVVLAVTQEGRVVAAAENLIRLVDPIRRLAREYGEEDGLMTFEPNQNAVYRDDQGLIWIGSNRGLVMYDPSSASPVDAPPPVALVKQRLALRDTLLPGNVSLAHDQNNITFDVSAIELTRPRKVLYQYKLEGYDADWSLPTSARFITYQNLPPGDYTFQARAAVNVGEWSITPAGFPFEIEPPIWLTWWFLTLLTLAVTGLVILGVRQRIKIVEEQNRQLEAKVKERTAEVVAKSDQLQVAFDEIERKNQDITESILYARRIQRAILPEDRRIQSALPESFVYFRPKDIVSGDFYWFDASESAELALIAACDCTGHGVPGAFMSVISYALLNQIQRQEREIRPNQILHELDGLIRNSLRQNEPGSETKDGLDMALCVVDRQQHCVHFAGAMRPLYYVRDGQVHEVKGSRFAIGGLTLTGEAKQFAAETIVAQPGDVFYLFSDGVVDQFGGDLGRKYTPKRLKELLLQIHNWPMDRQQHHVVQEMATWQGSYEQLDDQLIIGFRV